MTDMTGPALRRAGRTPRHRGHALFLTLAVGLAAWGVTRAVVPPDHTSETSSQPAAATAGNAAASPAASRPADRDTTLGSKLAVAQRPGDAPPVQNAAKGPVGGTDKAAAPGGSPRDTAPSTNAQAATPTTTPTDATPPAVRGPKNPVTDYGLWVLAPAIVAILLAALTRQVVPALVAGILLGAFMMLGCLPASNVHTQHNSLIGGVRLAVEAYILGTIRDPDHNFAHLKIIVFTLLIGFMVGVIGKNGGTRGMVRLVTGESRSPRRGALTAWLAGMVVFFDDYANTMIVGPTMRSVFDRLKLSRAKLAYIVDSTAAPVSSIALIGTWVGTEISYIEQGLTQAAADGLPLVDANGVPLTGMGTFLASIPYRFYPLLALFLVFIVALTGRDIGPMKRAERKALSRIDRDAVSARGTEVEAGEAKPCWWLGIFPILALVLGTVIVLIATGMHGAPATDPASSAAGLNTAVAAAVEQVPSWWQRASNVVAHADSYISIFYGAILASVVAVGLTLLARACSLRDVVDAGMDGLARMTPAIAILVLAWALSQVLQDLQLGTIVAGHMKAQGFAPQWLPLAVFVTSAVVSFATGTSWGTMGIMCPMTVATGAGLVAGLDVVEATSLMYAAVGSVLAGAVFGDHCSPISDTTVLSSIASGCRHEEHVWTQIPYALLAAVASMGLGDVLCSVYKQPWYYGLAAGGLFLVVFMFAIGRRAVPSFDLTNVYHAPRPPVPKNPGA